VAKKVTVTVTEGPEQGFTHTFASGSIKVGRAKNEVILSDKKISGKHCEFSIEGDQVFVTDLGSTNGTFLGGKKVQGKMKLQNLDEVTVGLSKISVAIVDELSAFKEQNQTSRTTGMTGPFELDDLSEENDEVLDGLLEDSESSLVLESSKAAVPSSTKTQRLVADDESTRHKANPLPKEGELPSEDAVYRETGIQRIDNLISDELNTFSKWDHPSVSRSSDKVKSIPKVKVVLEPRRGPEGISQVICTQPVTSLGRRDVDVRLNDLDCSRKHSSIEILTGNKVFVRDLASTNGTYVNGKKITYQELKTGDLLQIGQSIFEVMIEGS